MNSLNDKISKSFYLDDDKKHLLEIQGDNYFHIKINKFEKCGQETIDFINNLNPNLVLDLGCGDNQYKPYIKNLIGIDIVNELADIVTDISTIPFDDNSADAVICFGSINFGDEDVIRTQLLEMKRVMKLGSYAIFRGNMKDHEDITGMYYGWSEEKILKWSDELSLNIQVHPVVVTRTDRNGNKNLNWIDRVALKNKGRHRTPYRLYWIWKK
jgi:ubiquinone/menaquinone biosynthesis C-methylase UbiE